MQFFASAITTLQTLVIALGAGLGVWGVVNLLEGYGSDNPGARFFISVRVPNFFAPTSLTEMLTSARIEPSFNLQSDAHARLLWHVQ